MFCTLAGRAMDLRRLTNGDRDLGRKHSQYDASDMGRADEDKSNFRQRLLDALEEAIAEDGYPRTTVADIMRRARTSRRTLYEHFDSREACFVALLTEANAEQVRQISAAVDPNAPWRSHVRQAVEAGVSVSAV